MYRFVGIILIVLSAVTFGTLAIFGKYAYADGIDVITVLFLRFSFSAILMLALLVVRREHFPRGATLVRLMGMGGIGYVGQSLAYFSALKYASAGLVALLLYLYPTIVALLSVLVLREKITASKVLVLGLALAGTALTVSPEGGQALGILFAISAAVIYSLYIIVGVQVMKQVSALQSSVVIFASAGVVYGGVTVISGAHLPTTGNGWLVIAGLVLIATVIPVVTFLAGLERIGPTNAAMLSTLEPVVTVVLAAWLFGETLELASMLGGACILIAVFLSAHGELQQPMPV